ncbi:hypothetical protein DFJ73DRAFT_32705 [Zopfochytrium polystomum]|nr:hypothetical protein DFJ73DRAFT_32705 [Zopfochytrium polystomum]
MIRFVARGFNLNRFQPGAARVHQRRRASSKQTTELQDELPANVIDSLQRRSLIHALTSPKISSHVSAPATLYAGFDPTAKSLHVGNLLMIVALLRFQAHGHRPIALVGGATGSIGDPSGRTSERAALEATVLESNKVSIARQLEDIFRTAEANMRRHGAIRVEKLQPITVVDNLSWYAGVGLLQFLTDVGRFARVSPMLARESVRSRLENQDGLSFTEFTYQLLQAYDFHHLHKVENCTIQLGGSDQWGNITAGIDLIQKKLSVPSDDREPAFGVTLPLVTTSTGEKFGKSAGNAIWLDPLMLPPFDFFQFFRRSPDSEVEKYLKYFTFMSEEEIESIMKDHSANPEQHKPQRSLAFEVTDIVHGYSVAKKCELKSRVLFDSGIRSMAKTDLSVGTVSETFEGDPRLVCLPAEDVVDKDLVSVALSAGLVRTRSAGRKLLAAGGLYLNDEKMVGAPNEVIVRRSHLFDERVLFLRSGKSEYRVVVLAV